MINFKGISVEENDRLNKYINALEGTPKLVDCERLFEYLRILKEKYGSSVKNLVNKVNIKILRPAITYIWTKRKHTQEYRNKALELGKKSLFFSARDDFESFMLYTEIDRPISEQFWKNRRKSKLSIVCDALQDLADDKLDVLFIACPPRVGKLLADETPVLTRKGWKIHGDLSVGDEVISPNGDFVKVTHVHPKNYANYRVLFSNGETVDCHENHEWVFYDRTIRKNRIVETKELLNGVSIGEIGKRGGRYRYSLPLKSILRGEKKELPVMPYSLGVWLGDGHNGTPTISTSILDSCVIDGIVADGYSQTNLIVDKITNVAYHSFSKLGYDLRRVGMCNSRRFAEKHIPEEYLTASIEQRLELLAGLLDTDGCLRRNEHRYDFSTTSKQLKDDIVALISTFGWRTSVSKHDPTTSTSGINGRKICYVVSFNPTMEIPCRIDRKQLKVFSKQRRIAVKGIISLKESKQGNCITVDGGVYCVGKTLTPTHNSTIGTWFDAWYGAKATVEHWDKQSILAVGHNSSLVATFYEEIGQFVEGDKYKFLEVFPELRDKISYSAKYQTINFGEEKRYKTLSFRSADGSLAGGVEASLLLHIDDLIGGMEEALNPDRLEKKWQILYGDIRQRRKEGSKILYIGTIWSLLDPQVRFRELLANDENYRIKIIELPALDENDESNFDYKGGFSTAHYRSERAGMDEITWNCIYQQEPMEREGLLFSENLFDKFDKSQLEANPKDKGTFVDVAWGGSDYVAEPFIYEYDDGLYLADVVFNKSNKTITQPIVASKIITHKLYSAMFEENNGGDEYAGKVRDILSQEGYVCKITSRKSPNTPNAKLQRIIQYSPEIQKIKILEKKQRSPEYQAFISNMLKFNQNGKNKNDDAPDSLALYFMNRAKKPKTVTVLPNEFKIM